MTALPVEPARPAVSSGLLLLALGGAVAVRVAVAGAQGAGSIRAGLVFAVVLTAVAVLARARVELSARSVLIGAVGAVAIALPAVAARGIADVHPAGQFLTWGAATTLVATSEEAVLRGALFDALNRWPTTKLGGPDVAVVVAAIAFALLHVPLYGWHVVPLDLAVGLLLGALRLLTGGWLAPAVAHAGADLIGWWTV